MFGTNMELPNRILSYKEAYSKWASIKPIRGRSTDVRPLARRSNDNLTIRRDEDSHDIVVTLYYTDIIRYSADGDGYNNQIMLTPYPSSLTNRTMWSILGPHVNTYWSDTNLITEVGGRYYHTPQFALVQPHQEGWYLVAGAEPIEVPYLNRKEGRQALRDANYYTFKLWLEARIRLGIAEFGRRYSGAFDWTPQNAVHYLRQGETGWAEIAGRMSNSVPLEAELRSLREAVYQYDLCYDTKTVEYFTSYNEYKNATNQIKRVG